mgnify:CR=1 FL=1
MARRLARSRARYGWWPGDGDAGSTADRYQVVVHVDQAVLTQAVAADEREPHCCELDDGPALALDTARRLACDAIPDSKAGRDDFTVPDTPAVYSDALKALHTAVADMARRRRTAGVGDQIMRTRKSWEPEKSCQPLP